jgi:hypothetical protein
MYKLFTLRIVLMLWGFSATLNASDHINPVLTGTVNIVLANGNGIVVLTDSNQTETVRFSSESIMQRTSPLPGQKLFRIDDRTVCTVAGFGSVSLSPLFSGFTSSTAGILDTYVEELHRKGGTHSFHEKLTTLRFLFDFRLSGIGNLQKLDTTQLGDYGFELILAGYDSDGTAKIGKLILSTQLLNGIFSPVVKELTEKTVGRELSHETAGIGAGAVENILSYPGKLEDEPDIARYAASIASSHGRSLTVEEMEALATSLARLSALFNSRYFPVRPVGFHSLWPIGGPNQVAILKGGILQKLDQPRFKPRDVNTTPVNMMMGLTLGARGMPDVVMSYVQPGVLGLFLKMGFVGSVYLDRGYYFEDDFRSGTLIYDGDVLGFDPSNRITDCILHLGPHVGRNSPAVKELIAGFPWKAVN